MRVKSLIAGAAAVLIHWFGLSGFVSAQTRPITAQEYIQSTSPLPGGGSVTSRSAPGQKVQTVTNIAQLPSISQRQSSLAPGFVPKQVETAPVYTGSLTSGTGAVVNSNPSFNSAGNGAPVYAYPAPTLPVNPNYTAFRQTSTLGLGPVDTRVAQNCATCGPSGNSGAAYQAPSLNYQVPDLNGQVAPPPPSFQAPGFQSAPNYQAPAPVYQPNYQYGTNVGTPQYGAQGASWYTPFVTGSGVYTPLIKLRNMPPGTYLGQGVIGQPTAYVDGQPVRNLLRYISP